MLKELKWVESECRLRWIFSCLLREKDMQILNDKCLQIKIKCDCRKKYLNIYEFFLSVKSKYILINIKMNIQLKIFFYHLNEYSLIFNNIHIFTHLEINK